MRTPPSIRQKYKRAKKLRRTAKKLRKAVYSGWDGQLRAGLTGSQPEVMDRIISALLAEAEELESNCS